MLALIAAVVSIHQAPAILTERDRDVITAFILSRNKSQKALNWVMQVDTSGSLDKLCTEALDRHLKGKPELVDLKKSLETRNDVSVRLDTQIWDSKILLFDLEQKHAQRPLVLSGPFYEVFQPNTLCFQPELPGYTQTAKSPSSTPGSAPTISTRSTRWDC